MLAIQISSFGNPTDVIELIDIPEPPQPDAGQALVGVEFAPINHNDLLLIKGTFHWTPSLPYVVGNEGVGRVLAVGPTVSNVKVGDRVVLPLYSNTWQKRVLVSARGLVALPPEANVQQLSMLRINPTAAALMLSEYVDLKPGDWVIQNPSNSGVGRAVVAFGKARGLRLINLVRRQEAVAEVEAAGGEVVLVDDEHALDQITKAVGDGRVRLALDGVGGAATARLASALSQHGELVGYSFMGGSAAPGDFRPVMNKDITLHSFYEGRSQYDAKIHGILREATAMIRAGTLHIPIAATYPLTAIKEAVARAERGGGKVLLSALKA
jgi:NADPH:quinone reductase-like Zn-dependent oxidoreductase